LKTENRVKTKKTLLNLDRIFKNLEIDHVFFRVLHCGSLTSCFVFLIQLKTLSDETRPQKNQITKEKKNSNDEIK
jgi:hypothetical protein